MTVTCVQIGETFSYGSRFGYVPATELLQLIAITTGGAFVFASELLPSDDAGSEDGDTVRIPVKDDAALPHNVCHEAFLFLQVGNEEEEEEKEEEEKEGFKYTKKRRKEEERGASATCSVAK